MSEKRAVAKQYEFHFDLGDSTNGPIGLSARIWAPSKAAAVAKLRYALPPEGEVELPMSGYEGVTYLTVYFNPEAVTEDDIDEADDADGDEVDPQALAQL